VSRNEWIEWAEGVWTWHTIKHTDTLNTAEAKGENDTKHICPLQLPVIDRLVRMYSNRGEVVFSPFAGVGSEGVGALRQWRKFYGCEIKPEYFEKAKKNLGRALTERRETEQTLWSQEELEECVAT
jgi:DNA modification methylase